MFMLKERGRKKELKFLTRILERGYYIAGLDDDVSVKEVNSLMKASDGSYAVALVQDGVIENYKTYRDFQCEVHQKVRRKK